MGAQGLRLFVKFHTEEGDVWIAAIKGVRNPANALTKFTAGPLFIPERRYLMGVQLWIHRLVMAAMLWCFSSQFFPYSRPWNSAKIVVDAFMLPTAYHGLCAHLRLGLDAHVLVASRLARSFFLACCDVCSYLFASDVSPCAQHKGASPSRNAKCERVISKRLYFIQLHRLVDTYMDTHGYLVMYPAQWYCCRVLLGSLSVLFLVCCCDRFL